MTALIDTFFKLCTNICPQLHGNYEVIGKSGEFSDKDGSLKVKLKTMISNRSVFQLSNYHGQSIYSRKNCFVTAIFRFRYLIPLPSYFNCMKQVNKLQNYPDETITSEYCKAGLYCSHVHPTC